MFFRKKYILQSLYCSPKDNERKEKVSFFYASDFWHVELLPCKWTYELRSCARCCTVIVTIDHPLAYKQVIKEHT